MSRIKYWAIDVGALCEPAGAPRGHCSDLGNLAFHLWVGDGVMKVRYNTVARSAHIQSVGRVEAIDLSNQSAVFRWWDTDFQITPGPNGRRHWETKPYFILNAKRVRAYELPSQFVQASGESDWLSCQITDSYLQRNAGEGRLPSLEVREGFVYLMRWEDEYKIGKAVDVDRRQKRLSRELDRNITVLHRIFSEDYSKTEADLHERYASKRLHGEWFALKPEDVAWLKSVDRL